MEDSFPDIGSMSYEELKAPIAELSEGNGEVSYRRRILLGRVPDADGAA